VELYLAHLGRMRRRTTTTFTSYSRTSQGRRSVAKTGGVQMCTPARYAKSKTTS